MNSNGHNPDVIRRLLAVGCPVPLDDPRKPPPALAIEVCDVQRTGIFDYRAHVEYVFCLRLSNCSCAEIEIRGFECQPPWRDPYFTFLADSTNNTGNFAVWSSLGMHIPEIREQTLPSGRRFPRCEVLNQRKGELGRIRPGDSLEGVLLAWGMYARVPGDYLHGHPASVKIGVVDQHDRNHSSTIEVLVDRSATMPVVSKSAGKGLFEDDSDVAGGVNVPDQQVTPGGILYLPVAKLRRES